MCICVKLFILIKSVCEWKLHITTQMSAGGKTANEQRITQRSLFLLFVSYFRWRLRKRLTVPLKLTVQEWWYTKTVSPQLGACCVLLKGLHAVSRGLQKGDNVTLQETTTASISHLKEPCWFSISNRLQNRKKIQMHSLI